MVSLLSFPVFAGRPFITDDAGVVPANHLQVESWIFQDERSVQHWIVPTLGYKDVLEFSASSVHGLARQGKARDSYSLSGPVVQTKALLLDFEDTRAPGLSIVGGFIPPYGSGEFRSAGWDYFAYLAGSSYLDKSQVFNIHLNIGRQTRRSFARPTAVMLWGVALESKIDESFYLFGELSNGEIYALIPGTAGQLGARYELTDELQLDTTIGSGISGEPELPYWVTLGLVAMIDLH